jgi:hypothetical protein
MESGGSNHPVFCLLVTYIIVVKQSSILLTVDDITMKTIPCFVCQYLTLEDQTAQ